MHPEMDAQTRTARQARDLRAENARLRAEMAVASAEVVKLGIERDIFKERAEYWCNESLVDTGKVIEMEAEVARLRAILAEIGRRAVDWNHHRGDEWGAPAAVMIARLGLLAGATPAEMGSDEYGRPVLPDNRDVTT